MERAALEVEVAGLQAKDRLLALTISQQEQEFRVQNARLAEKRAALNRLTREAEIAKNTFATISAKATETVIAEGMKSGFVRVVDRAVARPVPRGTASKTAFAIMLGLMARTVAALLAEYFGIPSPKLSAIPAASNPHPTRRKEAEV